jgi:tungstate transport system substrate-binding protein
VAGSRGVSGGKLVSRYRLSDRGTWLSYGHKTGMKIVSQGDHRLLNFNDVILLNPRTHPQAKQEPAHRLADWLVSSEGQTAIADYTMNGQKLFHPEADSKP